MSTLQDNLDALSPARRKTVQAQADELIAEELTLQVRIKLNLTQEALAERLEIGQHNVSRLENCGDVKISTLPSYVETLGGQLNITVTLPDQGDDIRLSVVSGKQVNAEDRP